MGKWASGLLVAGIAGLGACSGAGPAPSPQAVSGTAPRPAGTLRPRSTTTTTTPEFGFHDSVAPPPLVNTGTDYVAILKSLGGYGNWLAAHHPDPALASTIIAAGTKLHDTFALDLTHLRDNGTRLIERLGGPSRYTILSATPNAFSARVVEDIVVHETVVPTGRVTSRRRYAAPTTYLMLAVMFEAHWHFAAVDVEQPATVHL